MEMETRSRDEKEREKKGKNCAEEDRELVNEKDDKEREGREMESASRNTHSMSILHVRM